jgi:hypothetical protein
VYWLLSHPQSESCRLPGTLEKLDGHAVQALAPVLLEYVPAGHDVHVVSPITALNWPAEHSVQVPSGVAEDPHGHAHMEVPGIPYLPDSQLEQAVPLTE